MKKTLYLLLTIFCPLVVFPKGFIIKGNIEGMPSGKVSLEYAKQDGEDTTIAAAIVGGAFTLSGTAPEPELVRLTITEGWAYNTSFYLENTTINIHLVKDAPQQTTITGSASEIVYAKLKPGYMAFFANARENEEAHQQNTGMRNSPALQTADSLWAAQQREWVQTIRSTISPGVDNYAALYFTRWLLFRPGNYDTILSLFNRLSPAVRNGPAGKKFLAEFQQLYVSSPGQPAPEINGKDTSGNSQTLAALKGKVVLLDFWASYCGPCRQENRRMLPVYQKYHAHGFEILSFSLDSERPAWVNAMQADGLLWPQVSELRGGASATANTYNISDLPRNVLIDRTGKIYAKDLHAEELIAALEILLAKGK